MSHPSKAKGNRFERELVDLAASLGLTAKRAWGSNGAALGESEEVDCLLGGKRVQAKRRKALPAYLQVPEGCDVVAFRQDRGPTLVLLPVEDYLKLLRDQCP